MIAAAKKYGGKAVGYELDKELVEQSRAKAEAAGVKSLVTIEAEDLFAADLRDADVIAVYLLPQQLEKLLPQFALGVSPQHSARTSQMRRFRASADTATLCRSPNTFSERDHQ